MMGRKFHRVPVSTPGRASPLASTDSAARALATCLQVNLEKVPGLNQKAWVRREAMENQLC